MDCNGPFFYFLCAVILLTEATIAANNNKTCKRLKDCEPALSLLKAKPLDPGTIQQLRSLHCGFEGSDPKVWCGEDEPVCRTPDLKNGTCKGIKQCPHVLDLLRSADMNNATAVRYVQKFRCTGSADVTVCCPADAELREPHPMTNLLPNPSKGECGIDNDLNRILGGEATRIDEFAWMAMLRYRKGNATVPGCGASLINDRYLVTAAHCLDGDVLKARKFDRLEHAVLGEYDTRNETDCAYFGKFADCADPVVVAQIESSVLHPRWNLTSLENDVALVRLARKVAFTEFIKPVCLPSVDLQLEPNEQLTVSGWGITETGRRSPVKMKVNMPLLALGDCSPLGKTLTDKQLCIGGEPGKDSCPGDSGGPVMRLSMLNGNTVAFLVGLVSFGHRICGISPAVYTNVAKYVEWIFENVEP